MTVDAPGAAAAVDYDPFGDAEIARVVPTTEPQREVWLADRLGHDASLAYNESVSLRFAGALDAAALSGAIADLVARHESLRSTFGNEGAELVIGAQPALEIETRDLSAREPQAREEALAEAKRRVVVTPFDLERGPLFRAEVLRLAADDHVLLLTAHHIVCDGWSFAVLARDLARLYRQRSGRPGEALPAADSFADYAIAQAAGAGADDERYWLSRFTGSAPVLDLPTDRPRAAWRTFAAGREDHVLDAALVAEARKLGARKGAGLFAVLLGGFGALLNRIAGTDDVVIGVPAAGQSVGGHEGLVGHCVNMLPLRLAIDGAAPASSLLAATQSALLDAYEHQGYTFGTLLRKLVLPRDPSRMPLVSVMFNVDQALDPAALDFGGLAVDFATVPRAFENFELFVNAVQAPQGLVLECQYNSDLFDAATVRRWLAGYETLMRSLVAAAESPLARLAILGPADRERLEAWNATTRAFDSEALAHELFERRALAAPGRPALEFEGATISYAELDARAGRISRWLRDRGVGRGALVGLKLARGPAMVAAMLGTLKAGAGYVPLDPAYPEDRLRFMAEDARLAVVVTGQAIAESEALEPAPSGRAAHSATPSDPAYVIYTSGSTGRPKGVRVPHRAVVNFLQSMSREPGLADADRLLAVTTLSFDIAVNELLLPLSVGACIVLASSEEAGDGALLARRVAASGANVMQATPATWRMLLAAGWRGERAFKAMCGGEALAPDLARELLGRVGELWNMYGPTETTVWSTCVRVESADAISIGRPIANTAVRVVDDLGQDCPVGVPGEIWIGGAGVTLGYLDRPELTAERFVDGFYRTGDRGRWRPDGTLEHLGRLDFQVKVRGYRIELGEIEASLAEQPGVREAVALAREDRPGDVRLVAYVAPEAAAGEAALKAQLRARLPEYMVPQHVVAMAKLPRLPNGKLDRKALPAPDSAAARSAEHVAPATELERTVVARMEEVLALPGIGMTDNFFALGGHSLLAAQLAAQLGRALGARLPLRAVFEAPSPRELVAWIEARRESGAAAREAIPRRAERSTAPLSLMQHRVWFLEQLDPGRPTFNTPSAHRLRGAFDAAAFSRAFAEVVRRQEALRTSIDVVDNAPVQVIHPDVAVDLAVEDLRGVPAGEREAALMVRLEALAAEIFDLGVAPLFRVKLFRTGDDEHVFYFGPHHIIWDGWSFDLFYREMSMLYAAHRAGAAPALPELPVAYGDFAAWHRDWMQGGDLAAALSHWKDRLAGALPTLELAADRARPAEMTGESDSLWVHVDPAKVEEVRALGRGHDATLFMTLLSAFVLTMHRMTGQREIVVGVPVRGRHVAELEPIMGFFVNALPLRLSIDPEGTFAQLLAHVRDVAVDAFRHPDVPFEELVRSLKVPRDRSRFPVYQALFSFQDARARARRWGDLEHDMIHVMQPGIAEDVSLWMMDRDEGVVGGLAWNADILARSSAERLRARFAHAIEFAVSNPDTPLARMGLPGEEAQQLARWNATARSFDVPATVHDMVAAQAARTPERTAISFGESRLTYAELASRANALAHELRARGARRGERVGLFVERGPDMVAAMLGVLQTGAAYVPLDPTFPRERLEFMARDARLVAAVVDSASSAPPGVPAERVLGLDALRVALARGAKPLAEDEHSARPDDCAYVIYTSGTTGKPKGVQVPHRAVANFLASMQSEPGLGADDRLVAVTTLSFDIAVLELLLPLTVGAQSAIASRDEAAEPRELARVLERERATAMQATPGTWRMLLDSGWVPAPGFKAMVGGEALPPDLASRLVAAVGELWNMYGPTETTVWSTCGRVVDPIEGIRIGRPIANTQVHVLDERLEPTPINVPGEIWIGGAGVAIGYLDRPDLTAERFRSHAAFPGRIYRTGDRGRWRPDGTLEHLGRNDFQVKVRGFRIELGEIEARLAEHPGIAQAVAVAREDTPGDVRLVAYCVARGAAPGGAELREHLRVFLPSYMLPQHFVALGSIPLLPNGKIDRAALPAPDTSGGGPVAQRARAPATETERQLAAIWSGLLKIDAVGAEDNFFDIGGHSLLAMQAILAMESGSGKSIDRGRYLFETLGQIARAYDEAPAAAPRKEGGLRKLLSGLLGGRQ